MTKQGFGISAFWLKMIAIAAMTVDHIGYLFFPGVSWMRMVGRLTFPIMAFLIAEGYRHTHDLRRYETRLFVFALISMLPFYLAFGWVGNVGFTLLCGLLALDCGARLERAWQKAAVAAAFMVLSLPCDWGFSGVLAIYLFGRIENRRLGAVCGVAALLLAGVLKDQCLTAVLGPGVYTPMKFEIMCAVLLAIPPLLLYNGSRGRSMKYWFYIYYPLHLAVLGLIARLSEIVNYFMSF